MGRGETVYCWGEHWLSVMCWCLLDGTNEVCKSCWSEDGCLGCMTGSGCVGSFLEEDDVVCCTAGNGDCCNLSCGCN